MAAVIGLSGAGGIGRELKGRHDICNDGDVDTIPAAIVPLVRAIVATGKYDRLHPAGVAELADASDPKSNAERNIGSSPTARFHPLVGKDRRGCS